METVSIPVDTARKLSLESHVLYSPMESFAGAMAGPPTFTLCTHSKAVEDESVLAMAMARFEDAGSWGCMMSSGIDTTSMAFTKANEPGLES